MNSPQFEDIRHEVRLLPAGELLYSAMKSEGFHDCPMLTLALPLRAKSPGSWKWFQSTFHKFCARYGRTFGETIQFRAVATRGKWGEGNWSVHVVFKGKLPTGLKTLVGWWNERYGRDRAKLSAHHNNGLRYWCKNYAEPGAETWDGKHNKKRPEPVAPSAPSVGDWVFPESEDPWELSPDDL